MGHEIEEGRLRLDPAPVLLADLLEDVEGMLRPQAQAKGLHFSVQTLGTAPVCIRVDAKRLRQILINLLSNSVRFTERGEVLLRLDFRQHVSRIEVIDTGIGIAPQDQERIFLPFERGSAGRRSSDTGTGLGLTITHLLTHLMGGELKVYSTPGKGSNFTVRLYLPGVEPDQLLTHANHKPLRPAIGYLGPRRTLLIVDDQALQRQLLASLLLPLGFMLMEAASGRECLEIVLRDPPDMVLLDITMDDLDGWETTALLRQLMPPDKLPIVFVSANLFDDQPQRLQRFKCQGFVGKPIIESELMQALERVLEIEWVRDNTLRPATLPDTHLLLPQASLPPMDLPEGLREELTRLARQGLASGVQQALREALLAYPAHTTVLQSLQVLANRFDFPALIEQLSEDHTEDDHDLN